MSDVTKYAQKWSRFQREMWSRWVYRKSVLWNWWLFPSFHPVTPSIEGPVTEGSHLLLTCNLSFSTGNEHFQWKQLDEVPTNRTEASSRSVKILNRSRTLEFSQVSSYEAGTWECSVHGPDGKMGSVQYHLKIAGTLTSHSHHLSQNVIELNTRLLVPIQLDTDCCFCQILPKNSTHCPWLLRSNRDYTILRK